MITPFFDSRFPLRKSVDRIIDSALKERRAVLLEHEAKRICNQYKIQTPRSHVAMDSSESAVAARTIGFPVVLKIVSPDILHKSDANCVLMDLRTTNQVKQAFRKIMTNAKRYNRTARLNGVLVERMEPPAIEVIIGGFRDPQFGQTTMFGLGGIFVEVFEDVAFRVAPLTSLSARNMIREIKGYSILKGIRGKGPVDEESLAGILVSSSKIMTEHSEIAEMDLNPVLAYTKGATVVDARMTLAG
jgi:acyl-CoA synthetase (NDP forming)